MSQPQCISRQRKTLQNAAGAVASENTIGAEWWKTGRVPPSLFFLKTASPSANQTSSNPPLSAPCHPPNHHYPAPNHADKTSDTAPLSSFEPPSSAHRLFTWSSCLHPSSPPAPLCSANVPCSNQLKSGVWASLAKSAFFLPHSGPNHHQPSTFPLRPWKTFPLQLILQSMMAVILF